MFKTTKEPIWLHRAAQFAMFQFQPEVVADSRQPDHPLSLFEGVAGTLCLLIDLERPLFASFPLFEV
jgi:hypothetical protein